MPQVADKSAANLILDGPRPGQENFFLFFEKFFRRVVRLKKAQSSRCDSRNGPVKPLNYHNGPVKLRNPVNRKYLCVEITGDSCAAASNYRLIMHRLLVFFSKSVNVIGYVHEHVTCHSELHKVDAVILRFLRLLTFNCGKCYGLASLWWTLSRISSVLQKNVVLIF
jgi:hypothetical protein